jgi:bacterioferritin
MALSAEAPYGFVRRTRCFDNKKRTNRLTERFQFGRTYGTGAEAFTEASAAITALFSLRSHVSRPELSQSATRCNKGRKMTELKSSADESEISRDRLAELLNEDLAREYQAIISYVVYSQVLKGAQYMDIADQLESHAKQELDHALIISRQIDYLGKMPAVTPKPVRTSKNAEDMLRYDLENENETVRNYRDRIRQCEALGEYAMAEQIRQIVVQEQDHQIDLATALGIEVPDVSGGPQARALHKRG